MRHCVWICLDTFRHRGSELSSSCRRADFRYILSSCLVVQKFEGVNRWSACVVSHLCEAIGRLRWVEFHLLDCQPERSVQPLCVDTTEERDGEIACV